MKNRFEHNRLADFRLNYHMVWSTAFNRKVIDDDVAEVVLQTIRSKSEELGVTIHEIEVVDQCYVECCFSAPPKICLTDYHKAVKPASTKQAFKAYPELRNKCYQGLLWNKSFFVESVGPYTKRTVKRFIKNQERGSGPRIDLVTGEEIKNEW